MLGASGSVGPDGESVEFGEFITIPGGCRVSTRSKRVVPAVR